MLNSLDLKFIVSSIFLSSWVDKSWNLLSDKLALTFSHTLLLASHPVGVIAPISLFLFTLRRCTNVCEHFSHSCHNEQKWSGNVHKFGSKGQSIVVWVLDCINCCFLSQLDICFRFFSQLTNPREEFRNFGGHLLVPKLFPWICQLTKINCQINYIVSVIGH